MLRRLSFIQLEDFPFCNSVGRCYPVYTILTEVKWHLFPFLLICRISWYDTRLAPVLWQSKGRPGWSRWCRLDVTSTIAADLKSCSFPGHFISRKCHETTLWSNSGGLGSSGFLFNKKRYSPFEFRKKQLRTIKALIKRACKLPRKKKNDVNRYFFLIDSGKVFWKSGTFLKMWKMSRKRKWFSAEEAFTKMTKCSIFDLIGWYFLASYQDRWNLLFIFATVDLIMLL